MPLSRLLTILIGITLILGMVLWLVTAISQLYSQVYWTNPFLANLLLLLVIALLAMLVVAFAYYFRLFPGFGQTQTKRRRRRPKIPAQKSEAAGETLQAVRKQVGQIQDEVARRALLLRSREIEQNLTRGDLRVVIFGTGSAGKTSLVNALLGRMVGRVDAPMGTTEAGATYCLKLAGLERNLLITDTPGILEAGVAGTERERVARSLAAEADLLLFVVDNDLLRSERRPLEALAEIGKRSLLVFNKTDLYPEEEREIILGQLRERVRGAIAPSDVVAIAAHPQAIPLDNGGIFQAEPDIMPLIRRMAAILRAEGDDLVADNILLQSQRLGEEARRLIDNQRRRQADRVVDRFQWIGAGVIACTPVPVIDVLATAAVNAQMVVEIGKIYGCDINMERGRELALSLGKTLASLGIVEGAVKLVTAALQFNLSTFAVGKAIQGVTAAYLTRIAGKSFIEYFRHDQDWGDGGMTEVVQQQFQLTRKDEFVKAFVKDAIARVVEPLKQEGNLEAEIEGEIEGDRDDVRSRPDFRPRREPDREYEYEDEDEEYEVPGPLGELLYDDDDWQVDRRHHDDW
ncbi:GTP-binding protein [Oxynema sp. CENA135]|uniref:YcjF family protein n=1 Tax=Oxynema sp. CENA135 TaxID=984206 RepID=UPI00190D55F8|nr:GTP-binding protein [Oxynema sp. CENA135]MBK4730595.1 GTP-binding protein [Oxynema sp. CENA135]